MNKVLLWYLINQIKSLHKGKPVGKRVTELISNVVKPNKLQLVKKIQSLRESMIKTFEVVDDKSKRDITKRLDWELRQGSFSIILIRVR